MENITIGYITGGSLQSGLIARLTVPPDAVQEGSFVVVQDGPRVFYGLVTNLRLCASDPRFTDAHTMDRIPASIREQLAGTGVLTCTVISFPLGQTTIAEKVNEAENAVADGCQEFDYVLNVGKLKEHDYAYIEEEMAALTAVARKTGTAVKVIFETCYLADEEIAEAAKIASRVKPDFIKTSTGFGTGGATAAHVELMHANCGPDVCVKASGGIRSWAEAKAMLDAGASRLGVSAGMKIISELKDQEG